MNARALDNFGRFAVAPDQPVASYVTDKPVAPSRFEMFTIGTRCLSFDQSLGGTGWTLIEVAVDGLHCRRRGMITASADLNLRSVVDALVAGEHIFTEAFKVIRDSGLDRLLIAHETPPNPAAVRGSGMSSLLAAQSIHNAAQSHGKTATWIARPTWAKFICGNHKADKKEAHAALPGWNVLGDLPTNEAQRDALCVGLTALGRAL